MKLNDDVYDALKWTTLIALPAIAAAYIGLSQIWQGIPYKTEVPATITVLILLLGSLIGVSTANYNKNGGNLVGTLHIDKTDPDSPKYQIDVGDNLDGLDTKKVARLKVATKKPVSATVKKTNSQ